MEYTKTGMAGFALGTITGGIAKYGISIGLKGVSNSVFASVGDMTGNAAAQYILTGKVDAKEMIVSGIISFVCAGGIRDLVKIATPKSVAAPVSKAQGLPAGESISDEALNWLNKGDADNTVYFGIQKGKEVYIGVTKQDLANRLYQHNYPGKNFDRLVKNFDKLEVQFSGLTRNQARSIEQYYIENRTNFMNKINSISRNSEFYAEAKQWAECYIKQQ